MVLASVVALEEALAESSFVEIFETLAVTSTTESAFELSGTVIVALEILDMAVVEAVKSSLAVPLSVLNS